MKFCKEGRGVWGEQSCLLSPVPCPLSPEVKLETSDQKN
ncbi:hypothetical protein O53_2742 [Microcystis aeruginosa TAIHU98]|uniref:Uncharacterized protein n=1 Tax=Microcystis aeruginosa TAIHU98 TaxID=1134457 RepID=L7E4X6_MICAE|nr:hypothetical protein O53_2742 [Microcystis aeruginosa TAIHU98]ODV40274.1 hypothetical protein BFG60_0189 [Microcystis aeruginosa NIES-98]